jgi:integrase
MEQKHFPIFAELARLLAEKSGVRKDGRVASNRTRALAHETMFGFVRDLHAGGRQVQHLKSLNADHALWLAQRWIDKGLSASTLAQRMTALRKLYAWLGKPSATDRAKALLDQLPEKRRRVRYVAQTSKSWSEHGVDVREAFVQADRLDYRFGLMLRMIAAFGLRRSEVLQCRPWVADRGTALRIFPGEAKGGRPREIPIESAWQRDILDLVKSKIGKTDSIGWDVDSVGKGLRPHARLKYGKARYARCMRAIGMTRGNIGTTGHGLRAEYAENIALLQDVVPPTLGGTADQMHPDDLSAKLRHVSENLGHSRESVTGAYYGSFRRTAAPQSPAAKVKRAKSKDDSPA